MKTYLMGIVSVLITATSVHADIMYFHNSQYAAIATNLQGEAQTYANESGTVYAAMEENVNLFATQEDNLITQFVQDEQDALVTALPNATYAKLKDRQKELANSILTFSNSISVNMQAYLDEQKLAQADTQSIADQISQITKAIDNANSQIDSWNQMTALFYQACQNLSGASSKSIPSAINSLQDAEKSAENLKSITLVYAGSDGSQITNTVDQVALSFVKNTVSGTRPVPPGATLEILGLALDLAKIQKQQVQSRLSNLEVRESIFRQAIAYRAIVEKLLIESDSESSPITTGPDETNFVFDVWRLRGQIVSSTDLETKHSKTDTLRGTLLTLRQLAVADFLMGYEQAHFELALARAKHQESITLSEQNDQMYRQAILRSTASLADYYKGGFTEQDFATVIQAAQSVALFIIAGNIK
jgi:hypothetical protein